MTVTPAKLWLKRASVAGLTLLVIVGCSPWAAGAVTRVSVSSSGEQATETSHYAAISADGRFVAFTSWAPNLVPSDTNGCADVFVHDRQTGVTERVSVASDGREADGESLSYQWSISADGRLVVFYSKATNLVAQDTNGYMDVFLHDRQTHQTARISVNSKGEQANDHSAGGSVSADGRLVVFQSGASNLAPGGGGHDWWSDVYLRDLAASLTVRLSVSTSGKTSDYAVISANGRFVAFRSEAYDLVPGDTNGRPDVFVRDLQTGSIERVSVSSSGEQGNGDSGYPSISADGRFVGFTSSASNLVPDDTNGREDAFVHDRQTGATQRVSVSSSGAQGNFGSAYPFISASGRCVAFASQATNFASVAYVLNQLWVRDRQTGSTVCVSVTPEGEPGNGDSVLSSVSADGRYVAFTSNASNLVPGDTNSCGDVFVAARAPTLEWAGSRGFGSDGVKPDTGAPNSTVFTFKVKYADPFGGDPVKARAIIRYRDCGGRQLYKSLAMIKESGEPATGAVYSATTKLPNQVHMYRFLFEAADGRQATGPPTAYKQGPGVAGQPFLCWTGRPGFEGDGVSPDSGRGRFGFEVLYRDSCGDAPTISRLMVLRNGAFYKSQTMTTTGPTTGRAFRSGKIYTTTLAIRQPGTYQYRFRFADGSGEATGAPAAWQSGPDMTSGMAACYPDWRSCRPGAERSSRSC